MWKNVAAAAIAAFLAAGLMAVFAGPIPYVNPQQLQIPATGADINALIGSINANSVVTGPGGNVGGLGSASGAFSVSQGNTFSVFNGPLATQAAPLSNAAGIAPYGAANANGVQVTGGTAGVAPTLAAVGSDANVNLALATQGDGLVQFSNEQQWSLAPTLAICPGYTGRAGGGPLGIEGQSLGPNPTISGYLYILDNLGKPHGIPVC